jgi:capping protein beta
MRRMPPNKIEQNLSGLLNLVPDATDELLQRVDQPLEEATCGTTGRKYLLCDYNRDGDSYRSPWSNLYEPPIEGDDGFQPSAALRLMEVEANTLYDSYREQYYEGGTSSVYLWDLEEGGDGSGGFAGCFLIKKAVAGHKYVDQGSWDSIHVVEITETSPTQATYKLTSTVMLDMNVRKEAVGDCSVAGTLTKQATKSSDFDPKVKPHVCVVGSMIEDMEIEMRSNMDNLSVAKTREIVSSIRKLVGGGGDGGGGRASASAPSANANFVASLGAAVASHGSKRAVDSET